jgi:hypothetical protein
MQSKLRKQILSNYGENGFNRRKVLKISLQNQIALSPIVLGLPGRKGLEAQNMGPSRSSLYGSHTAVEKPPVISPRVRKRGLDDTHVGPKRLCHLVRRRVLKELISYAPL